MTMLTDWNDTLIGKLKALYQDGLSFSLIAMQLRISRNSAIGKVHRLQLPKRAESAKLSRTREIIRKPLEPRKRRVRAKRQVKSEPKAPKHMERLDPIIASRDHLCLDLRSGRIVRCRYPTWSLDAKHHERLYCGCPDASVSAGVAYCGFHTRLCEDIR